MAPDEQTDGGVRPVASSARGGASAQSRFRHRRRRDGTSDVEQRIFAAFEQLLGSVPLAHMRIDDIAATAQISRRTFYTYFSSKEEVLATLAAQLFDEGATTIGALREERPAETGRVVLRRTIEENVALWSAHRHVLQAMTESWPLIPELRSMWLDVVDRYSHDVATEIDRERAAGVAPSGIASRRLASMLMWSTGHCLYIAGLELDAHLPDEPSISEDLVTLWMAAIYGETTSTTGARD